MKTLEGVLLEPQPVTRPIWLDSGITDGARTYPLPEGWGILETTLHEICGSWWFVRMTTHLKEGE